MMNKIVCLFIFLFMSCTVFGSTFSSGYVITKDKNDITVNLRNEENLQAKILAKVPNGTPMSCSLDSSSNPDFCFVRFDENQCENSGYIHKSRLVFLDKSTDFIKIPLVKKDLHSATYKNNQSSVNIKLGFLSLDKKEFKLISLPNTDEPNLFYQNTKVYGTDNEAVNNTYLYSAIEIQQNGKNFAIPVSEFAGLLILPFFVENDLIFDSISIYHNDKENQSYIFSTQADGAAVYTTVFELKNNRFVKKSVWLESY